MNLGHMTTTLHVGLAAHPSQLPLTQKQNRCNQHTYIHTYPYLVCMCTAHHSRDQLFIFVEAIALLVVHFGCGHALASEACTGLLRIPWVT